MPFMAKPQDYKPHFLIRPQYRGSSVYLCITTSGRIQCKDKYSKLDKKCDVVMEATMVDTNMLIVNDILFYKGIYQVYQRNSSMPFYERMRQIEKIVTYMRSSQDIWNLVINYPLEQTITKFNKQSLDVYFAHYKLPEMIQERSIGIQTIDPVFKYEYSYPFHYGYYIYMFEYKIKCRFHNQRVFVKDGKEFQTFLSPVFSSTTEEEREIDGLTDYYFSITYCQSPCKYLDKEYENLWVLMIENMDLEYVTMTLNHTYHIIVEKQSGKELHDHDEAMHIYQMFKIYDVENEWTLGTTPAEPIIKKVPRDTTVNFESKEIIELRYKYFIPEVIHVDLYKIKEYYKYQNRLNSKTYVDYINNAYSIINARILQLYMPKNSIMTIDYFDKKIPDSKKPFNDAFSKVVTKEKSLQLNPRGVFVCRNKPTRFIEPLHNYSIRTYKDVQHHDKKIPQDSIYIENDIYPKIYIRHRNSKEVLNRIFSLIKSN